jgi:hypothetical protein
MSDQRIRVLLAEKAGEVRRELKLGKTVEGENEHARLLWRAEVFERLSKAVNDSMVTLSQQKEILLSVEAFCLDTAQDGAVRKKNVPLLPLIAQISILGTIYQRRKGRRRPVMLPLEEVGMKD